MRVAFASRDGKYIDGHFGQCRAFSIFDLDTDRYKWLEARVLHPDSAGDEHGNRMQRRVTAVSDCTLLFVCSSGNDAAKLLLKDGIMQLKAEPQSEILPQLERLLSLLKTRPPMWLLNAMRRAEGKLKREL